MEIPLFFGELNVALHSFMENHPPALLQLRAIFAVLPRSIPELNTILRREAYYYRRSKLRTESHQKPPTWDNPFHLDSVCFCRLVQRPFDFAFYKRESLVYCLPAYPKPTRDNDLLALSPAFRPDPELAIR